jgi:hypothetical protein
MRELQEHRREDEREAEGGRAHGAVEENPLSEEITGTPGLDLAFSPFLEGYSSIQVRLR